MPVIWVCDSTKTKTGGKMKISPIFYMGNKKKLIQKGLIDLFPQNINTYVEPLGGSLVVALNVKANNYIINDLDNNLVKLYKMFKDYSAEQLISHIEYNICKYGLARERTKRNEYEDKFKIEEYKLAYSKLRDEFNSTKNVLDFYTLMFYSFSQQFRFNSKGGFNMPCGNDCFSEKNKEYIKDAIDMFKKFEINNKPFVELDYLNANFVYLDPPYLNTTATYNENDGWTMKNELELFKLCEDLTTKGIKFGMSNVFENKGVVNNHLIDWCSKNNFKVYTFDKHTYMACGKGNSNSKEVYICNY